jgi:hypothetical protein
MNIFEFKGLAATRSKGSPTVSEAAAKQVGCHTENYNYSLIQTKKPSI